MFIRINNWTVVGITHFIIYPEVRTEIHQILCLNGPIL